MATSVYPAQGGAVDNTSAASFIPEIWSDEVVAAYKSNLVLAPLVKKLSMTGKKGDTIHIPKPTRGSANAKVANTAVTIQNNVESEVIVSINKHFEFSRMIEDITNVQAHATLRAFYTGDAGYGLAKQIDSDLFDLSKSFGDGNGSAYATSAAQYVDASNGLTEYEVDTVAVADVFTDAGFRAAIQLLDDQDVPMDGRSFVVPPVLRNTLMGIDRYVSSDFVSGGVVANGKIGNLYGTDLYISTNCPTLETAAENSAGGAVRGALMFHKEAMILAEQAAVRSQTQYKQEFLGTLYTADTIYGTKVIRPESGLLIAVNG
jgi:N4-gp56 family major capsid protein